MEPISVPIRTLAKAERRSPKSLYELIRQGKIESFVEGKRRKVKLASYRRYVDSLIAEQQGGTAIKLPVGNATRPAATAAPAIADRSTAPQRSESTAVPNRHPATAPPKKKGARPAWGD